MVPSTEWGSREKFLVRSQESIRVGISSANVPATVKRVSSYMQELKVTFLWEENLRNLINAILYRSNQKTDILHQRNFKWK